MNSTFRNRYRVDTTRFRHWDYGNAGSYFITICTKHRMRVFGDVVRTTSLNDNEMAQCIAPLRGNGIQHLYVVKLSPIGRIAASEWAAIPHIRPDMHITLGAYVVMPDHVHGIITIGENRYNTGNGNTGNVFGPQRKNLGAIIRGFKSAVSMQARRIDSAFAWQRRYYDRIIRDEDAYVRVSRYILNNPRNWYRSSPGH
ncbi:hypothetical protein JXO52_00370 [bacterium]|nr:hypothetical protein [bacterium]